MSTESAKRIETEQIEEAAGDWLARRDSGNWSQKDQANFEAWLNESTRHRVAWLRLENAWESALRLKALGAGIRSDRTPAPGQWNLSPFFTQSAEAIIRDERKARFRIRALAASLVLAVAAGTAWYLWPAANTYETPVGGVASLPMADGSKVTLNTNSEIEVAMTGKERRIDLKHGEAFFEVAKDPSRPFVVSVGDKRVVAVGTKFSVRRDIDKNTDDIQVIVTEGVVRIESASSKGVENVAAQRLTAGNVARANRDGLLVQRKQLPDAEEQLSWRSGVLVFRDVTLEEAAAEFNRYNERKIVIENPAVAALGIAGNFRATNVDAFVRLLEQGYPVRIRPQDKEIILTAR